VSERPERRGPERRKSVPDRRGGELLDRREWLNQVTGNWDHDILPGNVHIGSDCYLESTGSFALWKSGTDPGIVIGDRVTIYGWTKFESVGSGFIEVGDDSILVGARLMSSERISIGRRVVVSHHVLFADSDMHPVEPQLRRKETVALAYYDDSERRQPVDVRPITVGDDVWIGAASIVLKGVTIGEGARVQAGSVVVDDIPAGAVVAGSPARPIEEGERP